MDHSRRKFLAGTAAAAASTLPIAGCLAPKAAPHGHRSSYTSQILQPGNANTVFHWTDVALQVLRMRTRDGSEPSKVNYNFGHYKWRTDSLRWSPTGPFYAANPGPAFDSFDRALCRGENHVDRLLVARNVRPGTVAGLDCEYESRVLPPSGQ